MNYQQFFEIKVGIEKIRWIGEQGIGRCPIPAHEDTHPSFSCNGQTGLWYCHSCGEKGNAYTLAEILNMSNPRQYLSDYSPTIKNGHNGGISPPKTEVKRTDEIVMKQAKYTSQLPDDIKEKLDFGDYMGMDDSGRLTFHYPNGIKHHKGKNGEAPYWEGDGSCQIFMEEEMSSFVKSKALYIFEGEKDALASSLQGISFSAGAGSIPDDITPLYDFPEIIISYDNDKAGYDGAERLAERIKKESPSTIVKIIQWDKSLLKGYDVYDDGKETGFAKFDEAVVNATEYTLPEEVLKEVEENKKGFELMKPNELIETYTTPPKSIIENLLVEQGVTIVSGTDGVGKTWFGLQMAVCIASGRDFLGFNVAQKPVLVIQFELSSSQLSSRLKKYDLFETDGLLHFSVLSDKDLIFTDAWKKIANTLAEQNFTDGVVVIDNLYTSTNKDVSKNHELKHLLTILDNIKNVTGNAFILIAHHNKNDGDREPILTKNIITGGKTLTNYVSNVFQIGTSSMGAELRRGKITKMRDGYTERLNEPLLLRFNPDECSFEYEGVIPFERLHCEQISKRWEYKVLIEFTERNSDKPDFNRQKIELFIQGLYKNDEPSNISKKTTRWLKKMDEFGFIKKTKYNSYQLKYDTIRNLNIDE